MVSCEMAHYGELYHMVYGVDRGGRGDQIKSRDY